MANNVDLKTVGLSMARAQREQRNRDAADHWERFVSLLETRLREIESGKSTTTAAVANSASATSFLQQVQSPMPVNLTAPKSAFNDKLSTGSEGYVLRSARVADGEAVVERSAVTVLDGLAYPATAANMDRPCHGVCVVAPDLNGNIMYRSGGGVAAIMAAAPSARGEIYLSVTPGKMTDNPDEPGKVFTQVTGHWIGQLDDKVGSLYNFAMDLRPLIIALDWLTAADITVNSGDPFRFNAVGSGLELEGIGGTWVPDGVTGVRFRPTEDPTNNGTSVSPARIGSLDIMATQRRFYISPSVYSSDQSPILTGLNLSGIRQVILDASKLLFYNGAGTTLQTTLDGSNRSLTFAAGASTISSNVAGSRWFVAGNVKASGYPGVTDYWSNPSDDGLVIGDNLLSNRDVHAQRHVYAVHKSVVGSRVAATSTDYSLQVGSGIAAGTDDAGTGDFDPDPDYQIFSLSTDTYGTQFKNHDGTYEGIDATQFWFDDYVNATGFIGDGSGLVNTPPAGSAGGDLTGTYPSPMIAANAVTNTNLRDSAALSVIGRSANSSGDPADIAAGTDNNVLRRSGTSIGFGAINLASSNAVSGLLPDSNLATISTANKVATSAIAAGTISNALTLSSTSNVFSGSGSALTGVPHTLYVQTADSSAIANTTTATDFDQQYTAPANTFAAGKAYRLTMSGKFGTGPTAGTLNLLVYIGSVAAFGFAPQTITTSDANQAWRMEMIFTCRTAGASGTVMVGAGTLRIRNTDIATLDTLKTIDTTVSNAIKGNAQWSVTDASHTITQHTMVFEQLN